MVECFITSLMHAASEAIQQMSELVNGLDNMIQISATPPQEATPTGIECAEASSVSLQVPPVDSLLDTPEGVCVWVCACVCVINLLLCADDNLPTPPPVIKVSSHVCVCVCVGVLLDHVSPL